MLPVAVKMRCILLAIEAMCPGVQSSVTLDDFSRLQRHCIENEIFYMRVSCCVCCTTSSYTLRRARGTTMFQPFCFLAVSAASRKLLPNQPCQREHREPPDVFILADVLPYVGQVHVCRKGEFLSFGNLDSHHHRHHHLRAKSYSLHYSVTAK